MPVTQHEFDSSTSHVSSVDLGNTVELDNVPELIPESVSLDESNSALLPEIASASIPSNVSQIVPSHSTSIPSNVSQIVPSHSTSIPSHESVEFVPSRKSSRALTKPGWNEGTEKKKLGTDLKMSETEAIVHGFEIVEEARQASKGRFWSIASLELLGVLCLAMPLLETSFATCLSFPPFRSHIS
ncbi:hypothetical protein V6N11_060404 [Hibiscus sabdariffa]|uniref:Uncharacterized protein n=1 Tax=Hibiscus sabdariffa TaxID=183260 RepID=A0ABR2QQD6_9ROSI